MSGKGMGGAQDDLLLSEVEELKEALAQAGREHEKDVRELRLQIDVLHRQREAFRTALQEEIRLSEGSDDSFKYQPEPRPAKKAKHGS